MWKNVRAWLLGRLGAPPPLPPVLDPVGVATLKNELVSGELAEVILLLDHLSGRSDRSISNLQIDPAGGDLVEAVFKAHWPPSLNETDAEISTAATIMFKARDQLNELAYPANGASIAFTIMVTGEDPHDSAMGHGKISTTRKGLASRAYPRYAGAARDFRRFRTILFYSLVVALLGTGFLSWHATEGQFFLQTITENDAKLTALLPDFYAALGSDRADQVIASTKQVPSAALPQFCPPGTDARPSGSCPMTIAHFCDGTGEIHDPVGRLKLCTQFVGLSRSRCIAAYSVKLWYNNWRWLASFFGPIPNQDGGGAVPRTAPSTGRQPNAVSPPPSLAPCDQAGAWDVEQETVDVVSADIVQVLGSAVLPMLYGLLGALAAIGLSIHAKTKDSTLMPRDRLQMRLQALLGVLIGGTIGLFLTPAAATSALGAAASNTTLSASGLSFLAGLGVDKVFRWLGSLIQAMFGGASAPPPPPSRPVMQAPSKLVPPSDGAVTGQG